MPRWLEVEPGADPGGGGAWVNTNLEPGAEPRWLKVEVEPPTISTYGCRNIRHRPVDNWVFGTNLGH